MLPLIDGRRLAQLRYREEMRRRQQRAGRIMLLLAHRVSGALPESAQRVCSEV